MHDESGAEQFVVYYVQALDWGVATNDMYLLNQISDPSCSTCRDNIDAVEALKRAGKIQIGGRSTLLRVDIAGGEFAIHTDYVFRITTADEAVVIQGPGGARTTAAPADSHDVSLVFVSWVRGRWRVMEEGTP